MKQTEKHRLTTLTRDAVSRISGGHTKLKDYAEKAAAKYSPTNAAQYQTLSEVVWWLIAAGQDQDAILILNTLCEVDDEYYWMFQALSSAFATRAWLHTKLKKDAAALDDAQTALRWIHRDPNTKAISESEVRGNLERFDDWLDRANGEKGAMKALHVTSHAMRVLVMYQQLAKGGDPVAKAVSTREYTTRLDLGMQELRRRIESW